MRFKTMWPLMLGLVLGQLVNPGVLAEDSDRVDARPMGEWVRQMKEDPRGPFKRIRWFCNDGSILPPERYACVSHGGGVQHGEWSDATRQIRAAGYPIANVLADLRPAEFVNSKDGLDKFKFLLLEQFLIAADDGWILRRARFYRGAFQAEGEIASATRILQTAVADRDWRGRLFPLLYEGVRLLPHGEQTESLTKIRGLATGLHQKDPGFADLRAKIHGRPDAGDAKRVRDYATTRGIPELRGEYSRLADAIEAVSAPTGVAGILRHFAAGVADQDLARSLQGGAAELESTEWAGERLRVSSELLALMRHQLTTSGEPAVTLEALDLALILEHEVFSAGQALAHTTAGSSRAQRLVWLRSSTQALYGSGLLTNREWQQIRDTIDNLNRDIVPLAEYRSELEYLARVPDWANRRLQLHFGPVVKRFAAIEPLARDYIPDRLRGSPLLFYVSVLDTLVSDANLLSGTRHEFFGRSVASGLRSLNAGVASGVLSSLDDLSRSGNVEGPSILIVPETLADLPPTSGILTANEGNPLSHVQLLARNLGLPNVVVSEALLPEVLARLGKKVVLAASPGGVVHLHEERPGSRADYAKDMEETIPVRIEADLSKLDLETLRLLPVNQLRATDSGVTVGPKAAQLGELTHRFPDAVSPALAIPFGVFRQMLNQPIEPGGPTAFEWMKDEYAELRTMSGANKVHRERAFLRRLRAWIIHSKLDPELRNELRQAMEQQFGADGSYGVFVRSDTNVEDLPGFTGAGLNLTVPNVVGFENVLKAIKEVWASPFSERAFGWRQALMDHPEHVYAAVLLHKSVPVDKSGVMITADADTDARDALSVVVNEGVGGGVEGQSAESLHIELDTDTIRLLASATAPDKRVLLQAGGSQLVAASGADRVLDEDEIRQLIDLARELPRWFSSLPGTRREPESADVEFGFLDGKLSLFQIRPFVDNSAASKNSYLLSMDASAARTEKLPVRLAQKPLESAL